MFKDSRRARLRILVQATTRPPSRNTDSRTRRVRTTGEAVAARVKRVKGVAEGTRTNIRGGGSKAHPLVWASRVQGDSSFHVQKYPSSSGEERSVCEIFTPSGAPASRRFLPLFSFFCKSFIIQGPLCTEKGEREGHRVWFG